ncbi:hypothetical protein GOP47_0005549 [Adiantum capillus-veneris]|uniref:Uncharacterized protein n=1 Tax=Adiantum capillus-veneris TaxID=13818 RepID=A0A9D4V5A2_ADICA|nr:hypothetical protein GOP47_0005549 [Adiantum capillus-veneris]
MVDREAPFQFPIAGVVARRLPLYSEFEEFEEKAAEFRSPRTKRRRNPSNRPHRTRNISAAEDFVNPSSLKRPLYFPDKALAVNPLQCPDVDRYHFYPGREWRDTDGKPIQAHGGGILFVPETKTFYWYGENKDGRTYRLQKRSVARVDVIGISCYSSKDLWIWKNEGIVLGAEKVNKSHDLYVSNVLERPKVIFNDKTKQYVMWMHVDTANYSKASVGLAISPTPVGPFTYLYSGRPHAYESRDMTLFKDDDGEAYLVYSSVDNSELHIGVLTDDYLNLERKMRSIMVGMHREAPAVFKHRGMYYMITSGCTGWAPNAALAHSAESMLGPWVTLGNPCMGGNEDFRQTTFFSQGTFVLPLPGLQDLFLFMADRWNSHDLKDSRYVWLPLTMDGPVDEPLEDDFEFPLWSRVSIHWHRRWRLPLSWNLSGVRVNE